MDSILATEPAHGSRKIGYCRGCGRLLSGFNPRVHLSLSRTDVSQRTCDVRLSLLFVLSLSSPRPLLNLVQATLACCLHNSHRGEIARFHRGGLFRHKSRSHLILEVSCIAFVKVVSSSMTIHRMGGVIHMYLTQCLPSFVHCRSRVSSQNISMHAYCPDLGFGGT